MSATACCRALCADDLSPVSAVRGGISSAVITAVSCRVQREQADADFRAWYRFAPNSASSLPCAPAGPTPPRTRQPLAGVDGLDAGTRVRLGGQREEESSRGVGGGGAGSVDGVNGGPGVPETKQFGGGDRGVGVERLEADEPQSFDVAQQAGPPDFAGRQ